MEPLPKQPQPVANDNANTQSAEGGTQTQKPPTFSPAASIGSTMAAGVVAGVGAVTNHKAYSDYERDHHGLWMKELVEDLIKQPREFVGGLRDYVLVGNGLAGNQGRTLAAIESVIGFKYSPVAEKWMQAAAITNPDQIAEIRAATGKTFDWILPESSLGTNKTTAPIASNGSQPAMVARKEVFHEAWLFAMAHEVMAWADKKVDTTTGNASFKAEDISGDKTTLGKLKAASDKLIKAEFPEADWKTKNVKADYATINVDWVLRFMVYHGLIQPPKGSDPKYSYAKGGGTAATAFEEQSTKVTGLEADVKKRMKTNNPKKGLFSHAEVPMALSSDKGQVKGEQAKIDAVTAIEAKIAAETDPKKLATLNTQLAAAKKALADLPAYRSFATSILPLLDRLAAANTTFKIGTYISHSWGQFSGDVFINTKLKSDGFWQESVVNQFFDDLNTAAEKDDTATGGAGKFAWRAIYNDEAVAKETNKKYGSGRQLTGIPGHGPDKIHIHLDLRPLNLAKDSTTGYTTNANGRVVVP